MTTIAIVLARGGSKGIPGKNVRPLRGRPLVQWVLGAAVGSLHIDQVYVSTDDEGIKAASQQVPGVRVLERDPVTANDTASSESALADALTRIDDWDQVILIQPTSPLLSAGDLDRLITAKEAAQADSALTVVRQKRFFWSVEADGLAQPVNYQPAARPRRQDFDGSLVENGAAYLTSRSAWEASQCRLSGSIIAVEMNESSYVEIDEPHDWPVIEALLTTQREPKRSNIRLIVSDVDGTMTDGGMYYGADGESLKLFNTRDAVGLRLLKEMGIEVGVITGENSPAVHARMAKLGITRYAPGVSDKIAILKNWCKELDIHMSQVAFIGDDINDIGAFHCCGFATCPADACTEIRHLADFVSQYEGGRGCIREVADTIRAQHV